MKNSKSPVLAWIDLEMTGLDPDSCVILELAMIITNAELAPLAPPVNVAIWQPPSALENMAPFVRNMHQKTGLLANVAASKHTVIDVERRALALLAAHAPYRSARLAGNSVGYDRMFMRAYMPHLEHFLHYRQLDVSSIKEAVKMWGGPTYDKPEDGKHTAMADIEQSIAELAFYRRTALVAELSGPLVVPPPARR